MLESNPDTHTPQPGEVWENDKGRFMVTHVGGDIYWATNGIVAPHSCTHDEWHDWITRTNARCILEAKKQ